MLVDWIYNSPTWLVGAVIVAFFVAVAVAGLAIVHQLLSVKLRRQHNELVGFSIAVVGVIYAVLLAFIAVTTWETFRKADDVVAREANFVGDVYHDTVGLPDNLAVKLRGHLRDYVDIVIANEWPAQQAGHLDEQSRLKGWQSLADFHDDIGRFRPANAGEAVLQAELLRTLNDLYNARRERILAAEQHVAGVVWWIIALGATLTVAHSYLFGMPNFKMHMLITAMLGASLAIVLVLIVAFDRPFRGSLSVSDDAFRAVRERMDPASLGHH
ncbi:MAG TPA: DUF4239 domain-containing protein [Xanthobacteraceae bacterium]|nr:DUF4239 domain-containing protein [Xanthobacteraceae bacterium]